MPDITMCWGWDCAAKDQCYRFLAKPNLYRQSFFAERPKCNVVRRKKDTIIASLLPTSFDDKVLETINTCAYFWLIEPKEQGVRSYEDALKQSRKVLGLDKGSNTNPKVSRRTLGAKMLRLP